MARLSRKSPVVQEYLRTLGNPYASSQMFDDDDGLEIDVAREYRLRDSLPDSSSKPVRPALSKPASRARAKRIFSQYIPALERGQLRGHHLDFITRNESCSPTKRFRLISALEKYDISTLQGLIPQFNRERDTLTESKLKEIERLAEDES